MLTNKVLEKTGGCPELVRISFVKFGYSGYHRNRTWQLHLHKISGLKES